MEEITRIKKITDNFNQNIHSLVIFAEIIGNFADEHDRKVKGSINKLMVDLASAFDEVLGELPNKVEKKLDSKEDKQSKVEELSEEQKRKFTERIIILVNNNKQPFFEFNSKYRKNLPVQGSLLRRSALISLMSTFETLISQLLREFYHKYPEALPSEAKSLSLADLRGLGSVEEAEEYLIDNEIDSILRGNIQTQLMCFEKPIKILLKPISKHNEQLIELSQRRNLLVHNDGKINRHYLNKTPKSLIDNNAKEGDRIKVTSSYLLSGIQTVYLVGTILIQQCFRKWEKETINEANDILIDLLFDSLIEQNYTFTESLAEYVYSIDIKNDKSLRIMAINHCIALREQKKLKEMEEALSKHDWSAVSLNFELTLSALRGEENKLYSLLNQAIAIKKIHALQLLEWPLFSNFRDTERFNTYFKDKFPDFKDIDRKRDNDIEEIEELEEEFES